MNAAPRILVIQTAFLGDVVLTTPLLCALNTKWPHAAVSALVIPETAPILEELAALDGIIVYDKRRGGLGAFGRVLREVRERHFNIVLSPHRSARSAFVARYSGAPVRIGYRESAAPWLYTACVTRARDKHETLRILALAEELGIIDADTKPRLVVSAEERAAARQRAGSAPYAVVSASSEWPTKRWSPGGFAAAGDYLAKLGYGIVLTGARKGQPAAATVAAAMSSPARNLAGETTVRELASLIAEAAIVVANDSAPVHVASAFGIPTVAVFGATVPGQGFGPLAPRSAIAEVAGLSCRPCGHHGGAKCPQKHFKCMQDLMPADVIKAINSVLA